MYQPHDTLECIDPSEEYFGRTFVVYESIRVTGMTYAYNSYRLLEVTKCGLSWDVYEIKTGLIENPYKFKKLEPENEIA